ncbi:hypothetical protein Micbo1qcDRAFT_199144 [Microdochium bolleyi]|uniref:2EXR domain-containing protein n=1 Tax=Microdochium bolleyi TaxID=196109 RepID=A0A136JGS6_9PEZI|nr:hypothetical protein Micbo1qcDRAFT_199144 [Microdochium bolleyi]
MKRATRETAGRALHFHMPLSLQRFPKFPELPYDIRHKIWELAIYVPGIHFLKMETNKDFKLAEWVSSKRLPRESRPQQFPYSSFLRPVFNSAAGDTSHYIQRNQALANLARSCNEARHLVDRAISHPDNMRLDHSYGQTHDESTGPLVAMAMAYDIVCIDYPDIRRAEGSKFLGPWSANIDKRHFGKIRHVAIRYHITWSEDRHICQECGRLHEARRQKPKMPRHLMQFLSLFPNLEMFYLIDCFAVKRPGWRKDPRSRVEYKTVECGAGRYYFEVQASTATLGRNITTTLDWIQDTFRDACEKGLIEGRGPGSQSKLDSNSGSSSGKPDDQGHSQSQLQPGATAARGPGAPRSRVFPMTLLACAWDQDAVDGANTLEPRRPDRKSRLSKAARDFVRRRRQIQRSQVQAQSKAAAATPAAPIELTAMIRQLSLSGSPTVCGGFDFASQAGESGIFTFGPRAVT